MSEERKTLVATPEQQAIINAAKRGESLLVNAGAGAAKTTTLKMLNDHMTGKKVLAVAFNKRIADDLQAALPGATVKTLNSLGHGAWSTQRGKRLELDKQKLSRITTQVMKETGQKYAEEAWGYVRNFTRILRNNGYVPQIPGMMPYFKGIEDPEELLPEFAITEGWDENLLSGDELIDLAEQCLIQSTREGFAGVIDFDDQIYLTTTYFCKYPQFDIILVDESQDLSPQNHRQLLMCNPKQLIAVGDPRQAIYAFRGADANSMSSLKKLMWEKLGLELMSYPLDTSFRCPKAVVARQQIHYPGFRAAISNAEGEVKTLTLWSVASIPTESTAIICRNNAPLVALAFVLIRNKRGFTFYGQDMSKNLKGLIKKVAGFTGKTLSGRDRAMQTSDILKKLEMWYAIERAKLEDQNRKELVSGLTDKKECARIVLSQGQTLGEAMDLCDSIFDAAQGDLVLTSGHRSKGFEWKHVFHLDYFRIPSKYAREQQAAGYPNAIVQENNLRYVIETRAKYSLTMMRLEDNIDRVMVLDEELE